MSLDNKTNITTEHLRETLSITNVGVFIWNLQTNYVTYSKEWAQIVGYEQSELKSHVSTWESLLFPEDLADVEDNLNRYLAGELPIYEAEFRMRKKDGNIIWGHDKGKVTQYDEEGKPLILCGVLQDITSIKQTQEELRKSTEILNLAIEVAEFGTWDWDLTDDSINYNDEYLEMLGYTQDEIEGTLDEWEKMNHPEDLIYVSKLLDDYINGNTDEYECEIRMRHKDGHYIWTRDVGKIVSRDENGNATRIIGGHLNIDSLKKSQFKLTETLNQLENHHALLETEIEERTKTLVEQDKLLLTVNDISQKLLTLEDGKNFREILADCLTSLAMAYDSPDITLWRFTEIDGVNYLYEEHTYENGKNTSFELSGIEDYILTQKDNSDIFFLRDDGCIVVRYDELCEEFRNNAKEHKVTDKLNLIFPSPWCDIALDSFEYYQSILLAPICLYNDLFGFVSMGSDKENKVFSQSQENMLIVSGKLFANAQKKHEMDEQLKLAHEEALLSSQAKSNFLANMSHEIELLSMQFWAWLK